RRDPPQAPAAGLLRNPGGAPWRGSSPPARLAGTARAGAVEPRRGTARRVPRPPRSPPDVAGGGVPRGCGRNALRRTPVRARPPSGGGRRRVAPGARRGDRQRRALLERGDGGVRIRDVPGGGATLPPRRRRADAARGAPE